MVKLLQIDFPLKQLCSYVASVLKFSLLKFKQQSMQKKDCELQLNSGKKIQVISMEKVPLFT